MEEEGAMKKTLGVLLVLTSVHFLYTPLSADVLLTSTFDDGTLQGWTKDILPFHGDLYVEPTGGNPGGFMVATDPDDSWYGMYAYAPALPSDLTNVVGIQWDEFIFDHGENTVEPTQILIFSTNGSAYITSAPLEVVGEWHARSVLFDDTDAWQPAATGSDPFNEVLENVYGIFIQMDCSIGTGPQSGVDNVVILDNTGWNMANAEASVYGSESIRNSSVLNSLAFFLVPIGAVISLRILRRRK